MWRLRQGDECGRFGAGEGAGGGDDEDEGCGGVSYWVKAGRRAEVSIAVLRGVEGYGPDSEEGKRVRQTEEGGSQRGL